MLHRCSKRVALSLVEGGLVKLHDSYFPLNKNIWQDICLQLGKYIRISISLLILPKIPWKLHVSTIFSQKSSFAYSLQWRSQSLPGWATRPPGGPKWGRKWEKFEESKKNWSKCEEKWWKWNTCPPGTVRLATTLTLCVQNAIQKRMVFMLVSTES